MNERERILKTFRKEKIDRIVWQPRIEHWFNVNRIKGTIPEKYKNLNILELYKELDASVRYYGSPLKINYKKVEIEEKTEEGKIITIYKTPFGSLTKVNAVSEIDFSSHLIEYPLKNIEDIKIMEYILKNTEYYFDYQEYQKIKREIGEAGVVQFFYPRSPLQRIILDYVGFERTIFWLYDYPKEMKTLIRAIEESDDQLYEVLVNSPVEILNFGENIDSNLNSPRIFEEYFIPYYEKRVEQLHKAGKFCHIHMDGALKPLLKYLHFLKFDGIEAVTFFPQGDVTPEELKSAIGEKILLDGIPAIFFLPSYSYRELEEFTLKIIKIFSPNLILGISDELPPSGDIEKVRFISNILTR